MVVLANEFPPTKVLKQLSTDRWGKQFEIEPLSEEDKELIKANQALYDEDKPLKDIDITTGLFKKRVLPVE